MNQLRTLTDRKQSLVLELQSLVPLQPNGDYAYHDYTDLARRDPGTCAARTLEILRNVNIEQTAVRQKFISACENKRFPALMDKMGEMLFPDFARYVSFANDGLLGAHIHHIEGILQHFTAKERRSLLADMDYPETGILGTEYPSVHSLGIKIYAYCIAIKAAEVLNRNIEAEGDLLIVRRALQAFGMGKLARPNYLSDDDLQKILEATRR